MSDFSLSPKMIALSLFELFPPLVRETLLGSERFRTAYGIESDARMSLNSLGISYQRSEFYDAVRKAYSHFDEPVSIKSHEGEENTLIVEKESQVVLLIFKEKRIPFPSLAFLAPDPELRISCFRAQTADKNLCDGTIVEWEKRLIAASLLDDEMQDLFDNLSCTPADVAEEIFTEVQTGECGVSILVPDSSLYYERLIAPLEVSPDLNSYVNNECTTHISKLLSWNFQLGLNQALLLSAHSTIISQIKIGEIPESELITFFENLTSQSDRYSQVGAIELGFSLIEKYPALEPLILNLVDEIRNDDAGNKGGRLTLTSSLIVFVDGELSRKGIFKDKPPFWRRLASIAQASLIEQQLLKLGIQDVEDSEWHELGRGQVFYMQTLVDLRLEPRWLPDLISPGQLRAEFLGRIFASAKRFEQFICLEPLRECVMGDAPESVFKNLEFPSAYLPGPLEGATTAPTELPGDLSEDLLKPPEGDILKASFFLRIVNSALIFRLNKQHALIVVEALRKFKYKLNLSGIESGTTFSLLVGLALVAAVTRCPELASEVQILLRTLRHQQDVTLEADQQMRIALIASAANSGLDDWCQSVGDWLSERAYEEIDFEMAQMMRSHIHILCDIVPQLWVNCAKAEAAYAAVPVAHQPQ